MSRKIGVSVVSMMPWSLGQNGLGRAVMMAYNAGFDGLQLLPLRGWNHLTFSGISLEQVISFELAWNCGSLWSAALRHLHLAGENNPLLHDWVLFGKCGAAKYRADLLFRHFQKTSMFVTHDVAHIGVMEMNPEMDLTADIYADYPHGLVWDTEHVIRPGRHGELALSKDKNWSHYELKYGKLPEPRNGRWENLLEKVAHNIRLIHAKAPADPVMLKALAKAVSPDCPVILEARPPAWIFKWPPQRLYIRMAEWLKEWRRCLGEYLN